MHLAVIMLLCLGCLICTIILQTGPRKREINEIENRYNEIIKRLKDLYRVVNTSLSRDFDYWHKNYKYINVLTKQIEELDKRIIANNNSSEFAGNKIEFKDE